MYPIQPQPAGLPSGTLGGRRRRAALAPTRGTGASASALLLRAAAGWVAVLLAWWAGVQLASVLGWHLPWAVATGTAHTLLTVFGLAPLLVSALALAVAPQCLGGTALDRSAVRLPLLGGLAGLGLAALGLHGSLALAAAGLALTAGAWALLAGRFGVLMLDSRVRDRDHARLLLLAHGLGVLSLWVAAVALALGEARVARAAAQLALWGSAGLALVVVAHRQAASFVAAQPLALRVWQSRAWLALLAGLMALQAVWSVAEVLQGGALSGGPATIRAGLGLGGGLALMALAFAQGLRHSLRRSAPALDAQGRSVLLRPPALRLLAMLHLGFAWLAMAFTLDGFSHALMMATDGRLSLGAAALHAFSIGAVGSLMLALATQQALARAQRPLQADHWTWLLCMVLQAGSAWAVLAALFPAASTGLYLLSLQFLLLAAVTWAWRYRRLLS